jgi:hypothetical protein
MIIMSNKQTNKYLIPVELSENHPNKWLGGLKTYEYRLYADSSEQKFTRIRFVDFNGFIIGEHVPTKLHTVYDKATMHAKQATVKAVAEIRQVVDGVADIAVAAATEVKDDMSKTAKTTAGIALGLYGRLKNRLKKDDTNNDPTV